MNREIAVVYGAGASHDSGYQMRIDREYIRNASSSVSISPPLDRNFFGQDTIKRMTEQFQSIRFFVEQYFAIPYGTNNTDCRLGLEEVWSAVDLNRRHLTLGTYDWENSSQEYLKLVRRGDLDWVDMEDNPTAPGDKKPTKRKFLGDCGRDLKRLCHRVYGQPELQIGSQDRYAQLHSLLRGMGYKVEYVTFNYDTCLEKSLHAANVAFHYVTDYGIPNAGFVQADVHVAKLHGSLNWTWNDSSVKPMRVPSSPYMDGDFWAIKPRYPSRSTLEAAIEEPLIIAPTWFKNEINDDSRVEDRVTQLILHQWRVALEVLRRADLVIVVGYSFPVTDFHVQRLFRLALMSRANADPLKLLYCCGADDKEEAKRPLAFLNIGDDKLMVEINGFSALCQQACLQGHFRALGMPLTFN